MVRLLLPALGGGHQRADDGPSREVVPALGSEPLLGHRLGRWRLLLAEKLLAGEVDALFRSQMKYYAGKIEIVPPKMSHGRSDQLVIPLACADRGQDPQGEHERLPDAGRRRYPAPHRPFS